MPKTLFGTCFNLARRSRVQAEVDLNELLKAHSSRPHRAQLPLKNTCRNFLAVEALNGKSDEPCLWWYYNYVANVSLELVNQGAVARA